MSETSNTYSVGKPPNFDGYNYSYWKKWMIIYLQSMRERVWMFVEDGWKPLDKVTDSVSEARPKTSWSEVEFTVANSNPKALLITQFENMRMEEPENGVSSILA